MGSDSLTVLAIVGIALFALVIVLIVIFAVVELRRWVRSFAGVGRVRLGPQFEINVQSDVQVIDEAHELRPFLRQLLEHERRDDAMRLYRAFTGNQATDADADLDAFVRGESIGSDPTAQQPASGVGPV